MRKTLPDLLPPDRPVPDAKATVGPTLISSEPISDPVVPLPAPPRLLTQIDREPEPRPSRPRRTRRRLLLAAVALLGVAAIAALTYESIVHYLARREALRLGLELASNRIELEAGGARLRGVRIRLVDVEGVSIRVDEAHVSLDGLEPRAVRFTGVAVALEGSIADRLRQLSAFSKNHPELYRITGGGEKVSITWSKAQSAPPWLRVTGGTLTNRGTSARFYASSAVVSSISAGAIGADWAADGSAITLGIGSLSPTSSPEEALLRVDVRLKAQPPTAAITLRPVKLETLALPLTLPNATAGTTAEGNATLVLEARSSGSSMHGKATLLVTGWVPPHPKELDSIVFGKRTSFTTSFDIADDLHTVTLTDSIVSAGALALKGKGSVELKDTYTLARLDLVGALPCAAVARSVSSSRLGEMVGEIIGGIAENTTEGSVFLNVHLEADSRDRKGMQIRHDIGIGCKARLPKLF